MVKMMSKLPPSDRRFIESVRSCTPETADHLEMVGINTLEKLAKADPAELRLKVNLQLGKLKVDSAGQRIFQNAVEAAQAKLATLQKEEAQREGKKADLYSIAFVPSPILSQKLVLFAQKHLGPYANPEYLLSKEILPHITLARFQAPTESVLHDVIKAIEPLHPGELPITLNGLYQSESSSGSLYAGFTVERTEELVSLQQLVADMVVRAGGKVFTPSGLVYSPHVTLCILKKEGAGLSPPWAADIINRPSNGWSLVAGESGPRGQFLKVVHTFSPSAAMETVDSRAVNG